MIGLNQMSLVGNQAAIYSSSFSPLSLFAAGEQGVWYDPSDFSTMFQDSAGTTPVTAVGQSVGKILDKSGRGNHATQATASYKPTLQQDSNGRYYLSFDGVNDGLVSSTINLSGTDKVSVFSGIYKSTNSANGFVCELSDGFSNNGIFALLADDGAYNTDSFYIKGTNTVGARKFSNTSPPFTAVWTGIGDISGSSVIFRQNGSVLTSSSVSAGSGMFGSFPLYIGYAPSNGNLNGRIYSLIVRGAASTTDELTATESWVNQRTAAY